ncbi:bifunctional DNA primase/polymerase [Streptomyces varsoviensis]|uniref:bifunctional DNA primase/polymerase n=1 Tax=Streptomyces varsoviensis TaxID=67373 RepID=UPI0004C92EA6|nr:bifunctional DNA primase/polymerase [Streptomyces varsoviensis]
MRDFLGRRRKLSPRRRGGRSTLLAAALTCATEWKWPVLPGVGLRPGHGRDPECGCPHPDCVVPGAHPFDPGLLAATTDARMIRWWWTNRPDAPVVLATGGAAPCAVSLPAVAGARALAAFDRQGVRLGPVVATPTRWTLLVAPYSLEVLGELLHSQDWVPGSLRFHGDGGYVALPPSRTGAGRVRWERAPRPAAAGAGAGTTPWLPDVATVVDVLVEESAGTPGGGSRLAH